MLTGIARIYEVKFPMRVQSTEAFQELCSFILANSPVLTPLVFISSLPILSLAVHCFVLYWFSAGFAFHARDHWLVERWQFYLATRTSSPSYPYLIA